MPPFSRLFKVFSLLLFARFTLGHYRFTTLITPTVTTKDAIRQPITYNPLMDATSVDMRCNVVNEPAKETVSVQAESNISLGLDNIIYHPGPAALYLGRVPEGQTAATWDGSGANWFKIKDWGGVYAPEMWNFEVLNNIVVNATIPRAVPPGEYLLRAEQIGLLIYLEPQYYVSCAQIKIENGGDGSPPLVEIPRHFQPDDPGLLLDIWKTDDPLATYRGPALGREMHDRCFNTHIQRPYDPGRLLQGGLRPSMTYLNGSPFLLK